MTHLLTYVGRQTSRSDGEARRVIILEATLRLIVKEGIRGVRHRAVAKEANVPLASTTYYFKNIKVLISDSLTYFAEKTLWMNRELENSSFELINYLSEQEGTRDEEHLLTYLTQFICEHIREQVRHSDDRILEMAFHEEALRNSQLADAISTLDDSFLATIKQFFEQLGSSTSLADAYQVLGLIKLLEYQYVMRGNIIEDKIQFEHIVNASVSKIIGISDLTCMES
ncbi:TetR family transcriptional regulator [Shewanella sp. D64]|uniref:TetR/AcrR family transcriptional regulator n=1 Tax=unclassified Shewanella TaxID=196818 RepID=UPI0022BA4787|nr:MULTISPECIES: TetR family transcriptional regulator [unclassified Shewanella]MEC4724781.1 TetR family transcriptional regulator [Shewanella sp. D64]MEC4736425.1 TetR family transcriptional regulator [Shewanella sp. E94]WBJ97516.1 TetR family transcriptional regulator [Shewanella sp. MTB7]